MGLILALLKGPLLNFLQQYWLPILVFLLAVVLYFWGAHNEHERMQAQLDALQAQYDGFVNTTRALGEVAEKAAREKDDSYKREKDRVDELYKTALAAVSADNKRLLDARAAGGYVPQAPANSRHPELACFQRTELEQALRQFDAGASQLLAEGDESITGLNIARSWAGSIKF